MFDAAKEKLAANTRRIARSPSHTAKAGAVRYRYYVSTCVQKGSNAKAAASLVRCSAGPLEELVLDRARRLGLLAPDQDERAAVRQRLHAVVVSRDHVSLQWRIDPRAPAIDETCLPTGDTFSFTRDRLVLEVAVRLQRRGGRCASRGPDGGSAVVVAAHDPALVKALVRAEGWRRDFLEELRRRSRRWRRRTA